MRGLSSSHLRWLLLCCPGWRPGERVAVGKRFLALTVISTPFALSFSPSQQGQESVPAGTETHRVTLSVEPGDGGYKTHFSLGENSSSDRHPAPTAFPSRSPWLQMAAPCPRVEVFELNFLYFKYGMKNVFSLKSPFQFSLVLFSKLFCKCTS